MTTEALTFTQEIQASLANVFFAFTNKTGWLDWFAHKSTTGVIYERGVLHLMDDKANNNFAFVLKEIQPKEFITFSFIYLDTLFISEVEISFVEQGDVVTVTLKHTGLSKELVKTTKLLWEEKLKNLQSVLESGKDLRLWNRPFLGVTVQKWVNPEYAAEKSLPVDYGLQLSTVFPNMGAEKAGLGVNDIIVSIEDTPVKKYETLSEIYVDKKAGDTVAVEYYHGDELRKRDLELTSFPVPESPTNAQDLADKMAQFYKKVHKMLDGMLEDQSEAQVEYRPAAGEWSAKDVLCHMIASEDDLMHWVSTIAAEREYYPWTGNLAARVKSLQMVYPTGVDLLQELKNKQQLIVAFLGEMPTEIINRKGTMARMSMHLFMDLGIHYKEHLKQIKDVLGEASDLRS